MTAKELEEFTSQLGEMANLLTVNRLLALNKSARLTGATYKDLATKLRDILGRVREPKDTLLQLENLLHDRTDASALLDAFKSVPDPRPILEKLTPEVLNVHLTGGFEELLKAMGRPADRRIIRFIGEMESQPVRGLFREIERGGKSVFQRWNGKSWVKALSSAAGIRSFTRRAQLDELVRTTSDIREIRRIASQMDNSTAGSLFERWVNHYVFHQPVGTSRARLSVSRANNPHVGLELNRSSDFFLEADGSIWDAKIYRSGGEIDVYQLDDYRRMAKRRKVIASDGREIKVKSINYIFGDRAAAEANLSLLHVQGGAEVWFIDDLGVLQHLD